MLSKIKYQFKKYWFYLKFNFKSIFKQKAKNGFFRTIKLFCLSFIESYKLMRLSYKDEFSLRLVPTQELTGGVLKSTGGDMPYVRSKIYNKPSFMS